MHRNLFAAQMAQYATSTVAGERSVAVENGIKCYLPGLKVAGNTFQKTYAGKNLINSFILTPSSHSSTIAHFVNTDGSILINGVWAGNANTVFIFATLNQLCLEVGKTYTIAIKVLEGEVITGGVGIYVYKGKSYFDNSGWIDNTNNVLSVRTINIKEENEYTAKIAIKTVTKNEDGNVFDFRNLKLQLMLYEGAYSVETVPEYEPYIPLGPDHPTDIMNAGDNGVEVVVTGNNLFDIDNLKFTGANESEITTYVPKVENGVFYSGGKVGKMSGAIAYVEIPTTIDKVWVTFKAQWDETETQRHVGLTRCAGLELSDAKQTVQISLDGENGGTYSFSSVTAHYPYIGLKAYSTNQHGLRLTDIQISYEQVPYEPYVEPQTITIPSSVTKDNGEIVDLRFAKVSDYADKLIVDGLNKKVIYQQWVSTYQYDGKETIYQGTHDSVYRYFAGNTKTNMDHKATNDYGYCTHLPRIEASSEEGVVFGYNNNSSIYFFLRPEDYPTVASVKTWLTNENPIVYWPRQTPIETDITDECGELLALIQNNGTTIIEASNTNNLSQTLTTRYLKHV